MTRLGLVPSQPPVQWLLRGTSFTGSKVVGVWGWHSPPSSAKLKNMWSCTSYPLPPWMPSWHVQGQLYLSACLFVVQRSHWLKGLRTVHGQKSLTEVTIEIALCWCYNAEGSLCLAVSQRFSTGWLCGDRMCHTNWHVTSSSAVEVDDEWRCVGCGVVLSGKQFLALWETVVCLSSESSNQSPCAAWPWRKRYYQPLKHWELFTQKRSSTFLKPQSVRITAARTSNFAPSTVLHFCKWNLLVNLLQQCGTHIMYICISMPPVLSGSYTPPLYQPRVAPGRGRCLHRHAVMDITQGMVAHWSVFPA